MAIRFSSPTSGQSLPFKTVKGGGGKAQSAPAPSTFARLTRGVFHGHVRDLPPGQRGRNIMRYLSQVVDIPKMARRTLRSLGFDVLAAPQAEFMPLGGPPLARRGVLCGGRFRFPSTKRTFAGTPEQ